MSAPSTKMPSLSALLAAELKKRKAKNSRYSLRAFARDLDIGVASLSEIMRERRFASASVPTRIERSLGLDSGAASRPEEYFSQISDHDFALIAQWQHQAILTLASSRGFREDVRWIAETLGIAPRAARESMQLLEKLGLLARNRLGKLERSKTRFRSSDGVPSAAVRAAHKKSLQLAALALDRDPVETRDFVSLSAMIDENTLRAIAAVTRKFMKQIDRIAEKSTGTSLYRVSVMTYPLFAGKQRGQPR